MFWSMLYFGNDNEKGQNRREFISNLDGERNCEIVKGMVKGLLPSPFCLFVYLFI